MENTDLYSQLVLLELCFCPWMSQPRRHNIRIVGSSKSFSFSSFSRFQRIQSTSVRRAAKDNLIDRPISLSFSTWRARLPESVERVSPSFHGQFHQVPQSPNFRAPRAHPQTRFRVSPLMLKKFISQVTQQRSQPRRCPARTRFGIRCSVFI